MNETFSSVVDVVQCELFCWKEEKKGMLFLLKNAQEEPCMSRDKLSFTLCDFAFDEKNGI